MLLSASSLCDAMGQLDGRYHSARLLHSPSPRTLGAGCYGQAAPTPSCVRTENRHRLNTLPLP